VRVVAFSTFELLDTGIVSCKNLLVLGVVVSLAAGAKILSGRFLRGRILQRVSQDIESP